MIRTGQQDRNSIRDARQVWINGEHMPDVTTHPMFKPLVDIRARIHDMAHEAQHAAVMAYIGETSPPQVFAQSPSYANLTAVYRNFNWHEPLRVVDRSTGLSDLVRQRKR
jgi:4-hydroxyphenylacetate 3-monooxygenase